MANISSPIIYLASDHAAFSLKKFLLENLADFKLIDLGCFNHHSCDYPDYAIKLAQALLEQPSAKGLALCGSGVGMAIALNRFSQIRAALCHDENSARLSRQHNDANILALGARIVKPELALAISKVFLTEKFTGGRHRLRVEKLGQINHSSQLSD